MSVVTRCLLRLPVELLTLGGWAVSAPWFWRRPPELERYEVPTADGWVLELLRLRTSDAPPKGPVILQHGLGASAGTFYFPGRSLARELAERGFDCWITNLRGREGSRPRSGRLRWDWCFEDYLDIDLPTLIEAVKVETGGRPLQYLGHSMGGILLFMYGVRHGLDGFASAVALASCLDYSVGPSKLERLGPLRGALAHAPRLPYAGVARLAATLTGRWDNGLSRMNHNRDNLEAALARAYYRNVYHDIAPGVLQSLATALDGGGFRHRDGTRYFDELARFTTPLLALCGDVDDIVSPSAVEATVERLGSTEKRFRVFGPEQGEAVHYGHMDLVIGSSAPREVWPVIAEWLGEHAGS